MLDTVRVRVISAQDIDCHPLYVTPEEIKAQHVECYLKATL